MKKIVSTLSILLTLVCASSTVTKESRVLNILLTNDDGYHTQEIQTLKQRLRDAGDIVFLVAPSSNQSGCGSSVQLSSKNVEVVHQGPAEFSVQSIDVGYISGPMMGKPWPATPAQCVLVGEELMHLAGCSPDLVLSGPNRGENVSVRCLYSGTVGAALVARSVCMGRKSIPSIAISMNLGADETRIRETAEFITSFVMLLDQHRDDNDQLLPESLLLNMNIPARKAGSAEQAPLKGIAVCRSGQAVFDTDLEGHTVFRATEQGNNQFRIDLCVVDYPDTTECSDNLALQEGYITIVPFVGDFTAHANMQELNTKLTQLFCKNKSYQDTLL